MVAGLVVITPGAGFVSPMASILIGGIGGIWGGITTGIFAPKAINFSGTNGLIYGNIKLVGIQLIGIVETVAYSAVMTIIILKVISEFMSLRVTSEEKMDGLDVSYMVKRLMVE